MKKLVLDIETNWTKVEKKHNPSPYLSTNHLVSVGYIFFDESGILKTDYLVFNHTEYLEPCQAENSRKLQTILDASDLVIGHNLKFDMSWLLECGFTYSKALYDTMIAEYVFSKGLKIPLSLAESCKRYGLDAKSDVLGEYRKNDINTDATPLKELIAYGEQDILITKQLYDKQQQLIAENAEYQYMLKAVSLMNQTLPALIDIERNGIFIDLESLDQVERDYREEYNKLKNELNEIVLEVMGHTPINLESSEHLSWVLYSRKVVDKKVWSELFNIGSEIRNSVLKVKHSRYMNNKEFIHNVKANTVKLKKTEASQCETCIGKGKVLKNKIDGSPFKKPTICKACNGNGYIYKELSAYAGFKLTPPGYKYASSGGFSTDKITLNELILRDDIDEKCKKFLTSLLRLNSISTYLSTFVEGIKKNVKDNILHSTFNQCVTATGRLSSSNPNFQNLPRAKTFPIRKVIKSRFKGGKIFSVDFKQLEFRVAAILAKDEQAKQDILNNIDIHAFTRDTITAAGQPMDRQDAKIRTFKPLYGGVKGTEAEEAYYQAFLQKYSGIDKWQKELENEALHTKQIKSPSGRIYSFPFVRRLANGSVSSHTQIKNYIVQGFATGDICPLALINIYHTIKNMKSKIILTVHDDITIDVHPDEEEQIIKDIKYVFDVMNQSVEEQFGIATEIPIAGDFSIGDDWLNKKEIAA